MGEGSDQVVAVRGRAVSEELEETLGFLLRGGRPGGLLAPEKLRAELLRHGPGGAQSGAVNRQKLLPGQAGLLLVTGEDQAVGEEERLHLVRRRGEEMAEMKHLETAEIAKLLSDGGVGAECCRHLAERCEVCGQRLAEIEALMKEDDEDYQTWGVAWVALEEEGTGDPAVAGEVMGFLSQVFREASERKP